jgi:hypothetical protein
MFNAGVASEVYDGGSAGNFFEKKICLRLEPIACQRISVTKIPASTGETLNIPLEMNSLDYHWKENAKADQCKKLQPNILYQPKSSNLESGNRCFKRLNQPL